MVGGPDRAAACQPDGLEGKSLDARVREARRATAVPLVTEAFSWQHGTFLGASVSSETTAAAGAIGQLRRDPFAMLPFCGYNMGDYMGHWLEIGKAAESPGDGDKLLRLYFVNWFRQDADGTWLWPGFGENSRVLKWIVERLEGTAAGVESPIGILPTKAALMPAYFDQFGDHLPQAITDEHAALVRRLGG